MYKKHSLKGNNHYVWNRKDTPKDDKDDSDYDGSNGDKDRVMGNEGDHEVLGRTTGRIQVTRRVW